MTFNKKLSDYFEIVRETIVPSVSPNREFYHYSIPAFDENKKPKIEKGYDIDSTKTVVHSNAILVSKLNPRFKRIWRILECEKNAICSTEFIELRFKNKQDERFMHYLIALLNTSSFTNYMHSCLTGTSSSHQRVRPQDILDFSFTFSSEENMLHIGEIFYAVETKIELNHQMNQILEKIGRALFKHWFVDFEFPNEECKPYKSSGGEMVDLELGEIPKGWRIGNIGDLLNLQIGGDWGADEKFQDAIPAVVLRGTDLASLKTNGYADAAPIRWLNEKSLTRRKITNCDILIGGSGLGPIGKTVYASKELKMLYEYPVTYSNFCKRLSAKNPSKAVYSEKLLEDMYGSREMKQYFTGTSIPNLDINSLLKHQIIIPPEDILDLFYGIAKYRYSKLYGKENIILRNIRDSLLPRLMSGKIRVKTDATAQTCHS